MTAGPVGRHFRLVAPPPPQSPANVCQDFPRIPRPPSKTLTYYWLILQSYAHMIHSQWMAHVSTLFSQIRCTLNRWVIATILSINCFFFFGMEIMNNRDEIFCSYLLWTHANIKQEASICNHFECEWINLPRQIVWDSTSAYRPSSFQINRAVLFLMLWPKRSIENNNCFNPQINSLWLTSVKVQCWWI